MLREAKRLSPSRAPGSVHKMFSRFASASRRAARHLSTAAAGDGSGFLIAGGVGVAAIACMAPRADEGHAAAPALPADEASKKLLSVLAHGEELAKIAKVKATMPDNIAIQKFGTAPCGNQPERNRSDAVAGKNVASMASEV